ncbi:hypothetical protein PSTEL_06205 [Paenibacillus stellifer]|uniref:HTH LytTR-type domain-containing protein n=1 Tax=Paenibacillus stellifer TaxID=169760 RepID=A0A089LU47_9BACL|nr:LytTR family transcriptional regulator DNA-binding domain-containing protein [Paenibacillus stellifer]AIQ62753.1 hypothetical protein PSTEL_06205 [Paenibacillus stellifer]
MLSLTVTEDENGAGIQPVSVDDILFLQTNMKALVEVHTREGKYYTVGPLRFWESAFAQGGFQFVRLDRGVLANLEQIKCINTTLKFAYFDYPVTNRTKYCMMSDGRYKAIMEELPADIPRIETILD